MLHKHGHGPSMTIVFLLLVALSNGVVRSDEPMPVGAAISQLQKSHSEDRPSFVIQSELNDLIDDKGGGACASAAGIDCLQSLRVMAHLPKLSNPHRTVLTSFSDQKTLLGGRVKNEEFVRLMNFYQSQLPGKTLDVSYECTPRPLSSVDGKRWSATSGPDLRVLPNQLKVLSYTVTHLNGEKPGRHFVLLKELTDKEVIVLDPGRPLKDLHYEIKAAFAEDGQKRFILVPPAQYDRGDDNELNTVFTISLTNTTESARIPVSVEAMKMKLNEAVSELHGKSDYLSPRAWRQKTASFGLPGLDLPKDVGRQAWPPSKMIEVFKHAGRSNLNFRDIVGGAHARPLTKSDNPKVKDVVRQVAAGTAYIAIAITEPDVGTNVAGIKSTAKRVEGGFLLTGKKLYNARLEQATHVIIFTQGTTGVPGKLSVFVTPIGTPGLKIEKLTAHGLTGNSFGGLTFDRLFIPNDCLIGNDGDGLAIFFDHFLYWRLMQSVAAIGTGENALEQMAERLRTRHVNGAPIGRFTHLQQPIGQHAIELKMAYAFAKEIAELLDQGDYKKARPLICGLKAEGVEIALNAVDAATRAFGGEGYSTNVDLGDRLRDLNGLRIADGTTDVMRMEVVRHLFGEDFWEMAVEPK